MNRTRGKKKIEKTRTSIGLIFKEANENPGLQV